MPSTRGKKANKTLRGNASQFFVAGELCRRGVVAVITMGDCPNTDILCSDIEGKKFAHVQVKTYPPGRRTCSVGVKAEVNYGKSFFWVLAGIPLDGSEDGFEYFVIPSAVMARQTKKAHKLWLETPGKNGRPHSADNSIRTVHLPPQRSRAGWSIERYRNRWDLILDHLDARAG